MSKFAVFFLIFTLGAIGFPGTSGFVGEYLTFYQFAVKVR